MHKFWMILVVISSLVALWFSGLAMKGLWDYSRLNTASRAEISEWRVVKKSSDQFAIEASYSFKASGRESYGKTIFAKPYFLNVPSSERTIKELKGKTWTVWYNSKDPSVSTLQKNFPFIACIQAFLVLAVTLYFVFLRGFLTKLTL